jgi:hypothetical protein
MAYTKEELAANAAAIAAANARNAEIARQRAAIQTKLEPLKTQLTGAKTILDPLQAKEEKVLGSQGGAMSKRGLDVITSEPYTTSFGTVSTVGPQVEELTGQLAGLQNVPVPQSLTQTQSNSKNSAYDLLYSQFALYGLESLVAPLKDLITEATSEGELTLMLRQTDAYKKRFAANAQRIAQGLGAISEADYIGLEDQYQNIMRQYGLPDTYYTKGEMGRQEGFEKFIANDISAAELEDRIMTAQNRVINANPEVSRALKEFYPDITNGDILAYTLDPKNAIKNIQRKVTAAEIGGAAMGQGLKTSLSRAEELAAAGITKDQAQQGYQTVAEVSPRGSLLSDIYKQGPYGQTQAEQEVFNLAGSAEAARQRKKLTSLETAAFSGQAGVGALARERAGNI